MKRNLIVLLTILVCADGLQTGTKERRKYGKRNEVED